MFSLNYIKVDPTTFLMQFKNGKLVRKGSGLSFWYYIPTSSLVAVPTGTTDLPFIFKEITQDYQEISVQGQVVYRIHNPEKLSSLMNFTIKPSASDKQLHYTSDDPEKLRNRIVNLVQVKMSTAIEQLNLRQAISSAQSLAKEIKSDFINSEVLESLGVEVIDLSIVAIKPSPETARALESAVREQLLQESDDALYIRRNASIEQERLIKENELNTELAVEHKQRQIKEEKLKAERALAEQRQAMQREKLDADIAQEQQKQALIDIATQNERKQADAKAYEIGETMKALSKVDSKVLEALTMGNLDPQQLMAQAFRELATGADKIGQLNITPDLLQSLTDKINS